MSGPDPETQPETDSEASPVKSYGRKDAHSMIAGVIIILTLATGIIMTFVSWGGFGTRNKVAFGLLLNLYLVLSVSLILIGIEWAWIQVRQRRPADLVRMLPAVTMILLGGLQLTILLMVAFFVLL